jgi:hypothetical protein
MDSFIKKIFNGNIDEFVHAQFQKFSRGEFKERALFKIKDSNGKYTVDSSSEYAKEFVIFFARKLGSNTTPVTGALISAFELSGFSYDDKSSAMGVRKYIFDKVMTGNEILKLCKIEKAFLGLSFKVGEDELKIRAKSPKSAKSAGSAKKEEDTPKIDFCKIKTNDKDFVKTLIFEKEAESFKLVIAKHDFIITDIVIPSELKSEKKFEIIREKAQRKGKVIRTLNIDGKKFVFEKEFLV